MATSWKSTSTSSTPSGVRCNDQMKFITEAEHVHSSSEYYRHQFEQLKIRLGIDSNYC